MTSVALEVTGMHCASCSALIKEVLSEEPGLVAVHVEPESERARVTYDESVTDLDAVRSAIAELGYGATVSEGPPVP